MEREKILSELSQETEAKIVLLVVDGLGGLPLEGQTPLEAAKSPNLDRLASLGSCGLMHPIFMGITPGSGPAHMALFGYHPFKYILGRGILEALGIGIEIGKNDMVARGNFATQKNDMVVDRRAGRLPTSENKKLCEHINKTLPLIQGARITVYPGKEHRLVVKFTKKGLSPALTDADPQKENMPVTYTEPLSQDAKNTADIVNALLREVSQILKDSPKANSLLLRGFSQYPSLPPLDKLYKLKPAAIAHYPMYRGLTKLIGMDILETGPEIEDVFKTLEDYYKDYTFFYVHIKKADSAGEDGNFAAKKDAIEETDFFLPRIEALNPDVLVITSDHSTPCLMKSHSWHPNPFLILARTAQPHGTHRFTEKECSQGYLGRFPALDAMSLMLAHAGKLKKFGA